MVRLLTIAALLAIVAPVDADDKDRDRKARAALALAGTEARAAAPAPRAKFMCYPNSHAKAVREQLPLVVWVGLEGRPIDGAISCRMDSFGDVMAPAIVVSHPAGDRMVIDVTLPATAKPADIAAAVKEATTHVGAKQMPTDKVAPLPLDWKSALGVDAEEPVGFRRRASAVLPSGPAITAAAPSAVSPTPKAPPAAAGVTASIQSLTAPACANGQCPAPVSRPVLRRIFGR